MSILRPGDKVLTRPELIARFGRPREQRIVFTNGCFDLLHRGHVEYLYAARELGDVLVVGLNGDDSVRRLKGPDRPLVPEDDRAIVLAGLGCVDAVTLFHEDTPVDLIAALLPDVLVKGGDYSVDEIVGGEDVREHGGEVVVIGFVEGRSTTSLVHRIQGVHR